MTQTEWSHLPNAKHIDWVIASIKVNPEKWLSARQTRGKVWDAALDAIDDAGRYETFDAARTVVFDAVWNVAGALWAASDAALDTIIALIAYDDCGYMIESEIGELKIIAAFGDSRAILLLPACIVFNETKALTTDSFAV